MTQQVINTGTVAGDGTGDPGRVAFTKTNADFTDLYSQLAGGLSLSVYGVDSGAVNAYVVAVTAPVPNVLVAGQLVRFLAANANTGPATVNVAGSGVTAIVNQTGAALTGGEISTVAPTTIQYSGTAWQIVSNLPVGNILRYGADPTGVADSLAAINKAIAALPTGGVILLPPGTFQLSAQLVVPTGAWLDGQGFSDSTGTGPSNRGATCLLRAFAGSGATVLINGDNAGLDRVDIDNNLQGTGECVQILGSRSGLGRVSTRNAGGDGTRVGMTNAGASSTNTNAWFIQRLCTKGNAGAGLRVDDTNTSVSSSYPLGSANANGGTCLHVDAGSNGSDGVQVSNANDNTFVMVVSQANGGCGIRFKTDGTNSGPRCNRVLASDCENNTGNDIQIDAATLPAAAPGLYNIVFGSRSVAVNPRIVDNSTGSLVMQWSAALATRAYHFGTDLNVVNPTGASGFNAYAGANLSPIRLYGVASGASDSIARLQVHVNGGALSDAWEINQHGVMVPYFDLFAVPYSAAMTIDASTGRWFQITASNGTAFTINAPTNMRTGQEITVQVRNTSGGALGAVTWNAAFKMSAWTQPATGNSRSVTFRYDGANWIQVNPTGVDVPN